MIYKLYSLKMKENIYFFELEYFVDSKCVSNLMVMYLIFLKILRFYFEWRIFEGKINLYKNKNIKYLLGGIEY